MMVWRTTALEASRSSIGFQAPICSKKASEPSSQTLRLSALTLPDRQNVEAISVQQFPCTGVTAFVRTKLRDPERPVPLRCGRTRATTMPMPEAAVDEHRPLSRAIHDVGGARKVARLGPESDSQGPEQAANDHFGRRVPLPHQPKASRRHSVTNEPQAALAVMRDRCLRTLSRNPLGKLSDPRPARSRKPAVAFAESGSVGYSRKSTSEGLFA